MQQDCMSLVIFVLCYCAISQSYSLYKTVLTCCTEKETPQSMSGPTVNQSCDLYNETQSCRTSWLSHAVLVNRSLAISFYMNRKEMIFKFHTQTH